MEPVKANLSADVKSSLTYAELVAQVRTLIFAARASGVGSQQYWTHYILGIDDTTSTSMAWTLELLSRNPKIQRRLREEVDRAYATAAGGLLERGQYDSMPLLTAVIKETLRCRPALPVAVARTALHDDYLPLSQPLVGRDGTQITQVVVPKGTGVDCSIAAYNMNPSYWGEDAHKFNPDRFLRAEGPLINGMKGPQGSMDGLASFIAGPRMCLGWRFAMAQMQIILAELVRNFEFEPVDGTEPWRLNAPIMSPIYKGQPGLQMRVIARKPA